MKTMTTLATLLATLAPTLAAAQGCPYARTAMSCADGQVYDSEKQACVPVTG